MSRQRSQPGDKQGHEVLDRLIKAALEVRVADAAPPADLRRQVLARARLAQAQSKTEAGYAMAAFLSCYPTPIYPAQSERGPQRQYLSYLVLTFAKLVNPISALLR